MVTLLDESMLALTKSAYFYKSKDQNIDHLEILNCASNNGQEGKDFLVNKVRENIEIDGKSYFYSLRVFLSEKPAYFIDTQESDVKFSDIIHAYIILIEIDNFLVILSKSCSNISKIIDKKFELLSGLSNTSLFSENAECQKLSLRNMTVSDKAIRSRSYEAVNLNGVLSLYGAGRSIPSHIKVRDDSNIISLSNSGRVNELSQRVKFQDIISWAKNKLEILQRGKNNEFLEHFAKRLDLSEVIDSGVKPSSILIDAGQLFDDFENNSIYFYRLDSKKVYITDRLKRKLSLRLEKVYELSELNKNSFLIEGVGKKDILKVNKKTLSIKINILSRLKIEHESKETSIQSYIKKNKLYCVTFTDPKYMYFMDSCFQDRSGISERDNILEILKPKDNFLVEDEKEPKDDPLTESSTEFSIKSVFGFVENLHKEDDYIFCDDLGTEWADHITINISDKSINFIHSKYTDNITTSASNLHEVVGQAIKNIGNMYFTKSLFLDKKLNSKFNEKYKIPKGPLTNISRVRKGDLQDFESKLDSLLKNHSLSRKCILCCPFLSKSQIETEFNKIKTDEKVRGHIIQLLWIISSFSHAAKEMNIIPIIYCNP
ncbi:MULTISPECIES: hypothetical protein [unclassified Mannheimia]|uniref:hypothetical protein n=1 Tax=unclassified Mannheimia TaxID=2645054 RepID=UPI00359EB93B